MPVSTQAFLRKLFPVGNSLWAVGQLAMLKQSGSDWKAVDALKVLSKSDARALAARKDIDAAAAQTAAPKK